MRHAGLKGKEAAGRQGLPLALVGFLTYSKAERAGDHRDDFRLRVRMRRNGVVLRQLEAKREEAFLARIAIKRRSLSAGRNRGRRGSPFDLLRRHDLVRILGRSPGRCGKQHRGRRNRQRKWISGCHRSFLCDSLLMVKIRRSPHKARSSSDNSVGASCRHYPISAAGYPRTAEILESSAALIGDPPYVR